MTCIAILNINQQADICANILQPLQYCNDIVVHIYSKSAININTIHNVENFIIPENYDTCPKMFNYIISTEKNLNRKYRYVNLLQDTVKIDSNPIEFIAALQKIMLKLKLDSWLSTTCDPMNYVYKRYNPRLQINLDEDDAIKLGVNQLLFTSHANTYWMCFDLNADIENIKFNELFSIPMYYTIEFLARRKFRSSNKISFDFMNMYPTIKEEKNVFSVVNVNENVSEEKLKEEYDIFNSLNLDITPTNMIDTILENLYNTIK